MGPKTGKSGVGDRAEKAPGQAAAKKGFAADRDLGDLEEKAYEGMSDSDDDGLTRAERKKLHRKASKQSRKARSMWEGDSGWSELQVGEEVLLGAEEGGFAGLEALDDPQLIAQLIQAADAALLQDKPSKDSAASEQNAKASKQQAKGQKAKEAASQASKADVIAAIDSKKKKQGKEGGEAPAGGDAEAGGDVDGMKSRIAKLEAENKRLKQQQQQQQQQQQKAKPAAGGNEQDADSEAADGDAGAQGAALGADGKVLSRKERKKQAAREHRRIKKERVKEQKRKRAEREAGKEAKKGGKDTKDANAAGDKAVVLKAANGSIKGKADADDAQRAAKKAKLSQKESAAGSMAEKQGEAEEDDSDGDSGVSEEADSEEMIGGDDPGVSGDPGVHGEAEVDVSGVDMSAWDDYGLHGSVVRALALKGFTAPTQIQAEVLLPALKGRLDIIGASQTGSGKTLAFGLPILSSLAEESSTLAAAAAGQAPLRDRALSTMKARQGKLRALILTPTRELALQVSSHLQAIGKVCRVRVVAIVGGLAEAKQARLLAAKPPVVVGTPGRLWDLMCRPVTAGGGSRRGAVDGGAQLRDLTGLSFLVLDEADRMVQQGHYAELENILDMVPHPGKKQDTADAESAALLSSKAAVRVRMAAAKQQQQQEELEELDEDPIMGSDEEGADEDEDVDNGDEGDEEQGQEGGEEGQLSDDGDADDHAMCTSEDPEGEGEGAEMTSGDGVVSGDAKDEAEPCSGSEEEEAEAGPGPGSMSAASAADGKWMLQTFIFSATLTLPLWMKTRLRKGGGGSGGNASTLENLMNRLHFRGKPKIVDLTTQRKLAQGVVEAFIHCMDTDRDELLYYLLLRHPGRTLVFVNAVSAIRRVTAILRLLGLPVLALHAQQQQRQRLKALDRFRASNEAVLIATDVAARGLDISGVSTVIHYQLPASADTYIHRCGRTARAGGEGVAIALVAAKEAARFSALSRAFARGAEGEEGKAAAAAAAAAGQEPEPTRQPHEFPVDLRLMPQVRERVKLAIRVDASERSVRKHAAESSWRRRQADEIGIELSEDEGGSDEDGGGQRGKGGRKGASSDLAVAQAKAQLAALLADPLQTRVSKKYFTGGLAAASALGHSSGTVNTHASVASKQAAVAAAGGKDKSEKGAAAAGGAAGSDSHGAAETAKKAAGTSSGAAMSTAGAARATKPGNAMQAMPSAVTEAVALAARLASSRQAARSSVQQQLSKQAAKKAAKRAKLGKAGPGAAASKVPLSRNQMKKQHKRGLVVIPPAFGRDAAGPNALDALRQRMAALGQVKSAGR